MLYRLLVGSLIGWLALLDLPARAQKKGLQDVVELKNGWVIRGRILSMPTDSVLEIETEGRNLFVFKQTEVLTMARAKIRSPKYHYQAGGYLNMTELGFLRGKRVNADLQPNVQADLYFTFQTFNGYQFNRWLGAGVTLAFDPIPNMTLMPVALGLRGDLTRTRVRLYYSLDTGYALDWLSNPDYVYNVDGGFLINPALGVEIPTGHASAFIFNLGFKSQRARASRTDEWGTAKQEYHFKRATVRFGFSF